VEEEKMIYIEQKPKFIKLKPTTINSKSVRKISEYKPL